MLRTDTEERYTKYIVELDYHSIQRLCDKIKRFCETSGILFLSKIDPKLTHHIPITLFPSPFPKEEFDKISQLQTTVNTLLCNVSNDHIFLIEGLRNVCREDEFTKKQVDIAEELIHYKHRQRIQVGIIRSDYMIDDRRSTPISTNKAHLVEYNTMSVSFGAHGAQVQDIHNEVLQCASTIQHEVFPKTRPLENNERLIDDITVSLSTAWLEYTKIYNTLETCILFVLQLNERNVFDHTKIERNLMKLMQMYSDKDSKKVMKIPAILFVTMKELSTQTSVDASEGILYYHLENNSTLKLEVALVYYRACYTPSDYIDQHFWDTRRRLELNRAVKVPAIFQQLTGAKKIQQLLTCPSLLNKFVHRESAEKLLETYAGTYSLDDDNPGLKELLKKVLANPVGYVLKPQREGGGNNVYGKEIVNMIEQLKSTKKTMGAFILMDSIRATSYKNYLVFPDRNEAILCDCVSEVGIWGMYVYRDSEMLLNIPSGYLLRSKCVEELDGGVASGRAVLDSLILY